MIPDTIRCRKGETNLAGYSYEYWCLWKNFISDPYNKDIKMIKDCLCSFYIEWMTLYNIDLDITKPISEAESMTKKQIEYVKTKHISLNFKSMPDFNVLINIDEYEDYVLEWIFHTTPSIIRDIIDYLMPDMDNRIPKLAASMYSYYTSMKLLSYSIRDKDNKKLITDSDIVEEGEPTVSELVDMIAKFMNSDKKEDNNG